LALVPQHALTSSQQADPVLQHSSIAAQQPTSFVQHFMPFAQQPSLVEAGQHALSLAQHATLLLQQSACGGCASAEPIPAKSRPIITAKPVNDFANIVSSPN